ncbi:MAG: TraR/DksA family transcriptional regulator [Elusimicrobiales bacterium]|jgi:DnaK suppressor protein|nr:TraR/DksA family transcriptional regulator [Elusimicrobiales bacterium]HOJ86799.1 TraR/DksA family transcriptional regulator [Elusimicrobiales bacterium]HOL62143.1 TraR/DksA family transcriptional regulator [Elusimicrobiales bacterium]HPO95978.1 TraR/DksA family transcriptional regulator [Elusimicrobiales bacterium]
MKSKKTNKKEKKQKVKVVKKTAQNKKQTSSKISDNFKEAKEILLKMKEEITSDIKSQITYENTKDIGDEIDDVTQTIEKEITFDLSSNEKNILKDIEVALKKIENKTYGTCDLCKNPIEPKRLKALPYTRYCIKCQIKQDNR